MTFREKFMNDGPDVGDQLEYTCPYNYGYEDREDRPCKKVFEGVDYEFCKNCWDREMPGDTVVDAISKAGESAKRVSEEFTKVVGAIEDSGNRRQFDSGAVRDMCEGKGRFDLVPLEVMSDMFATDKRDHDPILHDIAAFMTEDDTSWLMAALCNFATEAYGGCYPSMFLEVAKHFEEGAKKYGEGNYKKGIPAWCYIDSAVRHYLKWKRGDTNEHHDRAFVWNLMCCIWEVDYSPRAKVED